MDFDSFDPFDFQDSFEGSFATGSSQHDFMFPSEIAPTSPDTSFKDVFMVCEEEELCSLQPRKQSGSFFSSFDLLPDFGLKGDFFYPKEDEGYTSPRDVHDFPFSSGSETESSAAESVSRDMFNLSCPWDTREEGVWGEEDNSILTEQDQQEEEEEEGGSMQEEEEDEEDENSNKSSSKKARRPRPIAQQILSDSDDLTDQERDVLVRERKREHAQNARRRKKHFTKSLQATFAAHLPLQPTTQSRTLSVEHIKQEHMNFEERLRYARYVAESFLANPEEVAAAVSVTGLMAGYDLANVSISGVALRGDKAIVTTNSGLITLYFDEEEVGEIRLNLM
jgi:hypothetical protein